MLHSLSTMKCWLLSEFTATKGLHKKSDSTEISGDLTLCGTTTTLCVFLWTIQLCFIVINWLDADPTLFVLVFAVDYANLQFRENETNRAILKTAFQRAQRACLIRKDGFCDLFKLRFPSGLQSWMCLNIAGSLSFIRLSGNFAWVLHQLLCVSKT